MIFNVKKVYIINKLKAKIKEKRKDLIKMINKMLNFLSPVTRKKSTTTWLSCVELESELHNGLDALSQLPFVFICFDNEKLN